MNKQTDFILDTNILVRFLTDDNPKQGEIVQTLLKNALDKSLILPDVVMVEIVYVLLSVYRLTKEQVVEKIGVLLTFEKFKINTPLFQKTVELYAHHTISFVDAYLLALTVGEEKALLYTFDKKLLVLDQNKAKQP